MGLWSLSNVHVMCTGCFVEPYLGFLLLWGMLFYVFSPLFGMELGQFGGIL